MRLHWIVSTNSSFLNILLIRLFDEQNVKEKNTKKYDKLVVK